MPEYMISFIHSLCCLIDWFTVQWFVHSFIHSFHSYIWIYLIHLIYLTFYYFFIYMSPECNWLVIWPFHLFLPVRGMYKPVDVWKLKKDILLYWMHFWERLCFAALFCWPFCTAFILGGVLCGSLCLLLCTYLFNLLHCEFLFHLVLPL